MIEITKTKNNNISKPLINNIIEIFDKNRNKKETDKKKDKLFS